MISFPSKNVDFGRDLCLVAVFVIFAVVATDLLSKPFGAFCNARGPWGSSISNGSMMIIAIPILAAGFVALLDARSRAVRFPLLLILAGGIGNLASRSVFGCVLDITFVRWFPAFNIADVMLTAGCISLASVLLGNGRIRSL